MPWREDLDRTLELPAEPLDDLAPLESTTSGPTERRPDRIQTVSRPLPLSEEIETIADNTDEEIERELVSRRLSIARREQQHRHAIEMAQVRERQEARRRRAKQEARFLGAAIMLVVASGLAWIAFPMTDAAQIVFTTSFGVVAGYLGGRGRRLGSRLS